MDHSTNYPAKSASQGSGGSDEATNRGGSGTGESHSEQGPKSSRPGNAAGETDVGGSSSATPPRPQVGGDTGVIGGSSTDVVGEGGSVQEGNRERPKVEVEVEVEGDFKSASASVAIVGGSQSEGQRRKRSRGGDPGAGSSSSSRAKLDAPPEIAYACSVCGKEFGSWKGLFGHMRSHPNRQWRGVFPPPTFNRDRTPEDTEKEQVQGEIAKAEDEMASCLLNVAKDVLEKMGTSSDQPSTGEAVDGSGPSGSNIEPSSSQVQDPTASSSLQRRVFEIDLNVPQRQVSPPPPPQRDGSGLDLNMPAPLDSDDEAAT